MIKIGITGGIGSGKTIICKTIEKLGIPVYYSDIEAQKIINKSPSIYLSLTKIFGKDIYIKNEINKNKLAKLIFNNKKNLNKVNSIIHPLVIQDFHKWAKNQKNNIVVNESAIIFESQLEKNFNYIITVTAPLETKIERVIERENCNKQNVIERMNNQLPEIELSNKSNYVIINDNLHSILNQIQNIISQIQ